MSPDLSSQVEVMFAGLNRQSAVNSLPEPGTLSRELSEYVKPSSATEIVAARPEVFSHLGTAAVEMWLRSVHSFLISASLTNASPIWASVSGYYSSHYSIRAFAHLFGIFHLHGKKRIVYFERQGNRHVFRIEKKQGNDREHKIYWQHVSQHAELRDDPFFYSIPEVEPISDGAHRNRANYTDHVDRFPVFLPLNAEFLERRVEQISKVELSDVPVPRAESFPDIVSVQFVAYHRLVKFRCFLDEVLGSRNRFWKVQRNPSWCPGKMKFSVVEPVFAALYAGK